MDLTKSWTGESVGSPQQPGSGHIGGYLARLVENSELLPCFWLHQLVELTEAFGVL